MCKVFSKILPFIADAALIATGNPELIPVANAGISGVQTKLSGGSFGDALKSAGTSYLGSSIGGEIGNSIFPQTVGSAIGTGASNAVIGANTGISDALGNGFSATAANSILNASIGGTLGSYEGQNAANSLFPQTQKPDNNSLQPTPFTAKNNPNLQAPGSLSGLSTLTPDQQTSNLATQGVYGGGLGPQEQQYFTGLVNNQLVDQSGKVSDQSNLSPIENSYLGQLGFGGYSNSNDLLGAISKWQSQQAS